eukprot:5975131-Prymnesium_polylepis.1
MYVLFQDTVHKCNSYRAPQGCRSVSRRYSMQPERPCRVARAVCVLCSLNKCVLITKKPSARLRLRRLSWHDYALGHSVPGAPHLLPLGLPFKQHDYADAARRGAKRSYRKGRSVPRVCILGSAYHPPTELGFLD